MAASNPVSNVADKVRTAGAQVFSKLPPSLRLAVLHARGRYAPWEEGFDFTPPPLGPGEVCGPPHFVGIGVQKAGTTWWNELIASHPQVAARDDVHKERHYFDRFAVKPFGEADVKGYQGWFPREPGQLAGEWTPDYLHLPWVAPLLAQAAPQTHLLVLLRDPIERMRSGLSHHKVHRGAITAEVWADAIARGLYDQELAAWSSLFMPNRLLVLQYERCVIDPAGQLARTYRFLGLDPFVPEGIGERFSASKESFPLSDDVRHRLVDLYTDDVSALVKNHPELDLDLWPNFRETVTTR